MEPEVGDEEDPDEARKKVEAADPMERRLKPINEDQQCKGGLPAWVVRQYGDKADYSSANPPHGLLNYSVVVARSLWWPGSYSFFTQGKLVQIYVGDGHKYEQQSYYPVLPPRIQRDPKEAKVYDEPNPTQEFLDRKAKQAEQAQQEDQ